MRKIKYLLILFFMFVGINNVNAFDTSLKVYDYAQVLTTTEENILKNKIDLYISNYNMDMVLVTVKYHDKRDTMNYADDFYDYNGFGIGSTYDGVIFVIDFTFGYTDIHMSTTGKAINYYTDSRIDSILDAVASKKNKGYYEMFNAFLDKTDYYASQGIPLYQTTVEEKGIDWASIIIISLIAPTIVVLVLIFKNKKIKASTTASEYLKKDSLIINIRNDRFITTHTTSVRINDSSSSGTSSRSTTHRSSSGRSHGGGGRRL